MSFLTRLRFLPALLLMGPLVIGMTACDNAMPEPDPDPDPAPATATVTMNLQTISAVSDCDSGDNPGDFHFMIDFTDGRNQPIGNMVEIPVGTYGTNGESSNTIQLDDGESLPVNQSVSFSLPEEEGSAFTITMSMIEWDSATSPDPQANDVSRFRTYDFEDGRFQNIAGQQTLDVWGTNFSTCQVRVAYSISVS